MKKVINFRPIFYGFVALGLGIYFARFIFARNFYVIFSVLALIGICTFLAIKYKKFVRLVALALTFLLGIGVFSLSYYSFTDQTYVNQVCTVSGRISTVKDYSFSQSVVLDNTYINGVKVNKAITVNVSGANTLEVGYVITFTDYLEKTELFNLGEFNNYYYKYNIAYTASSSMENVTVDTFMGTTVSERLRESVRLALNQNMSPDEASISYASLFGDKTYVDYDIKESFSISGISHLLAVSGLHIGFITAILSFVLKKLKAKNYVQIAVISSFLLFYCYLCSFSVSVVRASLMFLVLSIASALGRPYDRLNSLGVAGIIVLLYKPLSVFDPGFLLSFFCVFSIYMFMPFFLGLFKKTKLPKALASALALTISVQIGLLPLTIYYYGQLSILTILANLICVPIFEIFFTLLFVITIVVLIIPPLGFSLKLPGVIITGIIKLAQLTASQKWAIIPLAFIPPIAIVVIYFEMFLSSHFLNLNKKQKLFVNIPICMFAIVVSIANSLPVYNVNNLNILNTYQTTTYVLELDGKMFAIGEFDYNSLITNTKYLNNIAHRSCDNLILMGNELVVDENYYPSVYSFSNYEEDKVLSYNKEYDFVGVKLYAVGFGDNTYLIHIFHKGIDYVFCSKSVSYAQVYTYLQQIDSADYLFCTSNLFLVEDMNLPVKNLVVDGKYIYTDNIRQKQITGNWTIDYNNDNIKEVRSID